MEFIFEFLIIQIRSYYGWSQLILRLILNNEANLIMRLSLNSKQKIAGVKIFFINAAQEEQVDLFLQAPSCLSLSQLAEI